MFEEFEVEFEPTARAPRSGTPVPSGGDPQLDRLFSQWEGVTFEHGLYRVHTAASAAAAKKMADEMFTGIDDYHFFFAVDWKGRQYAWCTDVKSVAIYEPAYGEAFDPEASIAEFHNHSLLEADREILCPAEFEQWRAASGVTDLPFDKCVGLTQPLFLGGTEDLDNMEMSDIGVYWSFTAQLRMGISG
jgi:hypothetical protein